MRFGIILLGCCRINSCIYQLSGWDVSKAMGNPLSQQLPGIFVAFRETAITSQASWDSGCHAEKRHGTVHKQHSLSPPGETQAWDRILLPFTNLPEGTGTTGSIPGGAPKWGNRCSLLPCPPPLQNYLTYPESRVWEIMINSFCLLFSDITGNEITFVEIQICHKNKQRKIHVKQNSLHVLTFQM